MNQNFPQLKIYTNYSLLEGVGKIDDYVKKAKEYGAEFLAITDNSMFGVIEFYKACHKNNIKPIIGLEVFLDGININGEYSLTLIAKNNKGYENLSKISSLSFERVFSRRNKIKLSELEKNSEGLFILSGGLNSEIIKGLIHDDPEVRKTLQILKQKFNNDFFVEVPAHNHLERVRSNLIGILKEMNFDNYIITSDTYYINKEDELLQNIVTSIKFGSLLTNNSNQVNQLYPDSYFKNYNEIKKSFSSFTEDFFNKGIENANYIANQSEVSFEFGKIKFPEYKLNNGKSEFDFLKEIVWDGINVKYKSNSNSPQIKDRVNYELSIINEMGFSGYFIIVWDFVKYAKENGIYVGPGRGSAAGSIVSYALGITEIDPIKYNLIFERFLNPDRVSMPDIDIDFDQEQRDKVIEYVVKKYGSDKVAHIITFGTLKARSSMRDIGRVLGVALQKVDKVAKLIPFNLDLKSALNKVNELKQIYNNDKQIKKVIDLSMKLEGNVRHASIHAAGIVISKDVLYKEIPLYSDGRSNAVLTQYQMKELEELGVLKIDFLGLKTLTILRKTIENINISKNKIIKLQDIPLDDFNTYKLMSKGDTLGVFQCESAGIQNLMNRMKIEKFEDIVALLALYRPGPLQSGMVDDFIKVKNGEKQVEYIENSLQDVLKETYGLMLYQEQIMQILSIMGGYSLGEADELRRAIGKKIPEIIYNNKEKFVSQAIKKGYTKEKAVEVYELIEKFGGYGFNKSHSVSYAMIAYWTAYFKANYTKEFFTALMSMESNNPNKLSVLKNEAKLYGIKTLLPDINKSNIDFSMEGSGIRFGLMSIRDIGISTVKEIMLNREQYGEFFSYEMFAKRLLDKNIDAKKLKALILSGCLDCFDGSREEKQEKIEEVINWSKEVNKRKEYNWKTLMTDADQTQQLQFPLSNYSKIKEIDLPYLLNKEKYYLGVYISRHPLDENENMINRIRHNKIKDIIGVDDFTTIDDNNKNKKDTKSNKNIRNIRIIGVITDVKIIKTKQDNEIAKFVVEDFTGEISVVCFSKEFSIFNKIIKTNNKVIVNAILNKENNFQVVLKDIFLLNKGAVYKNFKLCIIINDQNYEQRDKLKKLILNNKGDSTVEYFIRINKQNQRYEDNKNRVSLTSDFLVTLMQTVGEKNIKVL